MGFQLAYTRKRIVSMWLEQVTCYLFVPSAIRREPLFKGDPAVAGGGAPAPWEGACYLVGPAIARQLSVLCIRSDDHVAEIPRHDNIAGEAFS